MALENLLVWLRMPGRYQAAVSTVAAEFRGPDGGRPSEFQKKPPTHGNRRRGRVEKADAPFATSLNSQKMAIFSRPGAPLAQFRPQSAYVGGRGSTRAVGISRAIVHISPRTSAGNIGEDAASFPPATNNATEETEASHIYPPPPPALLPGLFGDTVPFSKYAPILVTGLRVIK